MNRSRPPDPPLQPSTDGEGERILAEAVERRVWPWVEHGQVQAIVDATFPLAQAAEAHRRLESGTHTGKVVLTV